MNAASATCSPLPQIDPAKGFFANFGNACYELPFPSANGSLDDGDSNAVYYQVFYQVQPGYQLVVLGTFPNSRFMSASLYDSHLTRIGSLVDYQIPPLASTKVNPYVTGGVYQPNEMYGFTVSFGGGQTQTVAPAAA